MKAQIVNIHEGRIRTKESHTVVMVFQKVLHIPDSNETMLDGVDYLLTVDIAKMYKDKPYCQTNNEYDPKKGYAYLLEEVKIGEQMENIILVSAFISDLCEYPYVIEAKTGQIIRKLNRVFFCSEEQAVEIMRNSVERGLKTDYYLPPPKTEGTSLSRKVFVHSIKRILTSDLNINLVEVCLIEELEYLTPLLTKIYHADVNTIKYRLFININQRYAGDSCVMTNGLFDEKKAFSLCQKEFPKGKVIDFEGKLYVFQISDITNGEYDYIQNSQSYWTSTSLYYAHLGYDGQAARNYCYRLIQLGVKMGMFILRKNHDNYGI
ncbi:MAG: hypothetical protein IJK15_00590 [Bacteroidaceae bacterium]|nr:hypothetical protein [Bacteroidaceae bacterium]